MLIRQRAGLILILAEADAEVDGTNIVHLCTHMHELRGTPRQQWDGIIGASNPVDGDVHGLPHSNVERHITDPGGAEGVDVAKVVAFFRQVKCGKNGHCTTQTVACDVDGETPATQRSQAVPDGPNRLLVLHQERCTDATGKSSGVAIGLNAHSNAPKIRASSGHVRSSSEQDEAGVVCLLPHDGFSRKERRRCHADFCGSPGTFASCATAPICDIGTIGSCRQICQPHCDLGVISTSSID
mmetsp:Transcript_62226/g.131518  ORF Transcript_62226/g.131518 Transcript_62226/m.131518 type:complete len:241 (-) Transcript_62226:399-1121(-)